MRPVARSVAVWQPLHRPIDWVSLYFHLQFFACRFQLKSFEKHLIALNFGNLEMIAADRNSNVLPRTLEFIKGLKRWPNKEIIFKLDIFYSFWTFSKKIGFKFWANLISNSKSEFPMLCGIFQNSLSFSWMIQWWGRRERWSSKLLDAKLANWSARLSIGDIRVVWYSRYSRNSRNVGNSNFRIQIVWILSVISR